MPSCGNAACLVGVPPNSVHIDIRIRPGWAAAPPMGGTQQQASACTKHPRHTSMHTHTHAHTYMHTHAHARTSLLAYAYAHAYGYAYGYVYGYGVWVWHVGMGMCMGMGMAFVFVESNLSPLFGP